MSRATAESPADEATGRRYEALAHAVRIGCVGESLHDTLERAAAFVMFLEGKAPEARRGTKTLYGAEGVPIEVAVGAAMDAPHGGWISRAESLREPVIEIIDSIFEDRFTDAMIRRIARLGE